MAAIIEKIEQTALVKIKEEKIDPEIEEKIRIDVVNIKKEKELYNREKNKLNEAGSDNDSSDGSAEEEDDKDGGQMVVEENSISNKTLTTTMIEDDKKRVTLLKSSNEILAELFQVFNAAPPQEFLDNKKTHNKHKKHKKDKKKKHKRSKSRSDGEELLLSEDENESSELLHANNKDLDGEHSYKHKHRHKKRKKHKHKEDKEKVKPHRSTEKSKERDHRITSHTPQFKAEPNDERRSTSNGNYRKCIAQDVNKDGAPSMAKRSRSDATKHNSFYESGHRSDVKIKLEPDEMHSLTRTNRFDDGHISEVSLSDEETYLKEREHVGETNSQHRFRREVVPTTSCNQNSFYAGSAARSGRNREEERNDRSRFSGVSRLQTMRRNEVSHSRERSRERDLGIDKKRLLEIARKNAISMFKRGNLPGCTDMSEEFKDKVLLKMRYGGRTVQDLTDFCKKISNGEQLSDLSSDEDSDVDKSGNAKAFHHPFLLKEREPIVMHIRNSTPIQPRPKSDDQTKAITMQFPVSSGQHHRLTEGWVPVETKESLPPLPALPTVTQSTNIFKKPEKNVFAKPIPQSAQQEPAFKTVGQPQPNAMTTLIVPPSPKPPAVAVPCTVENIDAVPPIFSVPPPPIHTAAAGAATNPGAAQPIPALVPPPQPPVFVADVPVPSTAPTVCSNSVFPQYAESQVDVSNIISKRLNAMRRLQDNPLDPEAIKMMHNSQKEMTSWASSKFLPGQFTGSTGVNVLKAHELSGGSQLWARRDQLTATKPVTGMGMQLLQKMGWKPGEGLGREKTGSLQPLLLDVKLDKRGLVSKEDNGYRPHPSFRKQRPNNVYNNRNHNNNNIYKHHNSNIHNSNTHNSNNISNYNNNMNNMNMISNNGNNGMNNNNNGNNGMNINNGNNGMNNNMITNNANNIISNMLCNSINSNINSNNANNSMNIHNSNNGNSNYTSNNNNGPSAIAPQQQQMSQQPQQQLLDKHPVCLLNELTSKRKWTPPLYTLINESGPSHSRMFVFSVSINGQTFTANQPSNTKKEAKMLAARFTLQQIGILP